MPGSLGRRALAAFVGTAPLGTAVVGSGIAASSLSPNDVGLQLFENAAATAGIGALFPAVRRRGAADAVVPERRNQVRSEGRVTP